MKTVVKAALLSILQAAYGDGVRSTASTHSAACGIYRQYVEAWDAQVKSMSEGDVVVLRYECDHFHKTFPGIKLTPADIVGYVESLKVAGSVVGG